MWKDLTLFNKWVEFHAYLNNICGEDWAFAILFLLFITKPRRENNSVNILGPELSKFVE